MRFLRVSKKRNESSGSSRFFKKWFDIDVFPTVWNRAVSVAVTVRFCTFLRQCNGTDNIDGITERGPYV